MFSGIRQNFIFGGRFIFIFCLFFKLHAQTARASCGLESCPSHLSTQNASSNFLIHAMARQASFDFDSITGNYTQLMLRFDYRGIQRLTLGGMLSGVRLTQEHHEEDEMHEQSNFGLGNPILFAEMRLLSTEKTTLALGSQLELPLGDDEHGIAANHAEIVPYLSVQQSVQDFKIAANLGLRASLSSEDHHEEAHEISAQKSLLHEEEPTDHHFLLVSPHEDTEFLYRFGLSRGFGSKPIIPQIFLDGQKVFSGDGDKPNFLSAGLTVNIPLNEKYLIAPSFELPISTEQRFEWKLSLGFMAAL